MPHSLPDPASPPAPSSCLSNSCDHADAMRDQAAAMRQLAEAVAAGVEILKPAAEFVHGCGERLDSLCKYLKSWKPWAATAGAAVVLRTVNVAPDEVPKLLDALTQLLLALGGAS
jgi:hypothetical protein